VALVFQGAILFFVLGGSLFTQYRIRLTSRGAREQRSERAEEQGRAHLRASAPQPPCSKMEG